MTLLENDVFMPFFFSSFVHLLLVFYFSGEGDGMYQAIAS